MPQLSLSSLSLVASLAFFVAPVCSQSALPEHDLVPSSPNPALVRPEYLAQNASAKAKSATDGIPAGVEVSIKEWVVPTPGSHPHDPLATPDGSIWYTGQMANLLGRLDPRTGEFREYRLKTPDSGPHGLVADKDGNIGSRRVLKAISASLIPRQARSANIPCPTLERMIRTHPCSIKAGPFGSPCKVAIWWADSCQPPATYN
jgi:hypothetical protein